MRGVANEPEYFVVVINDCTGEKEYESRGCSCILLLVLVKWRNISVEFGQKRRRMSGNTGME